jgi:hypothetical protein
MPRISKSGNSQASSPLLADFRKVDARLPHAPSGLGPVQSFRNIQEDVRRPFPCEGSQILAPVSRRPLIDNIDVALSAYAIAAMVHVQYQQSRDRLGK